MRNIILISVLIVVLAFSTIAIAQPTGPPGNMSNQTGPPGNNTPPGPPGNMTNGMGPPGNMSMSDNDTQPLRERLEAFYAEKEAYIEQKRQCKESVVITNAPTGTCWNQLKTRMLNMLLREVMLTERRLAHLSEKNITISNIDEINAKLAGAKIILQNSSATKDEIKSTARDLEELINHIEEVATQGQTDVLIAQMDRLMVKADEMVTRLEVKLNELSAGGVDITDLEADFEQFKEDLATAKENIDDAKVAYTEINSTVDISQLASDIRDLINDAQSNLEKAIDKAKALLLSMGSSGNGGNDESGETGTNETD